jgi:hypothetical protein
MRVGLALPTEIQFPHAVQRLKMHLHRLGLSTATPLNAVYVTHQSLSNFNGCMMKTEVGLVDVYMPSPSHVT